MQSFSKTLTQIAFAAAVVGCSAGGEGDRRPDASAHDANGLAIDGGVPRLDADGSGGDSGRPSDGLTLWATNNSMAFGRSLAIDRDGLLLAVGAENSVLTFSRSDINASFSSTPSGAPVVPAGAVNFGVSVAFGEFEGSTSLFVGDDQVAPGGAFHRFARSGTDFGAVRTTTLGEPDGFGRQRFRHLGASLSTFTDATGALVVVAGDPDFDNNLNPDEPSDRRGGIQSFVWNSELNEWIRAACCSDAAGVLSADFGWSVSASGHFTSGPHTVIVAGDRNRLNRAVLIKTFNATDFNSTPLAQDAVEVSTEFGASIALSVDALLLIVGDPQAGVGGAVTIWRRPDRASEFAFEENVPAPSGASSFGRALALRADAAEVFIGATSTTGQGAVYRLFL